MVPGRVSIVMPCYNVAKYVDEAIESLRNQTYRDVEIVCVNDGSSDATQEHLERQAESDPRVRVFSQKNAGCPAARNTGLRSAQGEFICFLDGDDVYVPDKIERQVRFLAEHPKVELVYSDHYTGDAELNLTALTAARIPHTDMVEAFAMRNWFVVNAPLLRRSVVEKIGEFDESLRVVEDWDYWMRCVKAGIALGYLPGPVTIYRTHGTQIHHDIGSMFRTGKRVIKKHYGSNRQLYQRALATWYARFAKTQWNADQRVGTAVSLAMSAFHNKLAALASLGQSRTAIHGNRQLRDTG